MNIFCGRCGPQRVRFEDFSTMLVLSEQVALLSYTCPSCGMRVGVASGIPLSVRGQARKALQACGADDGRSTWPLSLVPMFAMMGAYPPQENHENLNRMLGPVVDGSIDAVRSPHVDLSAVERFRAELDSIDGVDDAIGFMNGLTGPVEK